MHETIFPPTLWPDVLDAAGKGPTAARRAFEQLWVYYREAIVQWLQMQRLTPADAEDAAHDFLVKWLSHENPLQGFERGAGRFREFLRPCLRNFLRDWLASQRTIGRGGQAAHVPWEHDEVVEDTSVSVSLLDLALARAIHRRALDQLAERWAATPTESSSQRLPTREVWVTDWSFSFRCSPPRIAPTQLRFDTARLFAAQERTSTALFSRPLRRTNEVR